VVTKLNRTMIGWANYFCLGPVSKAYRAVNSHACKRLRQWLCAKHKVESGTKRFFGGIPARRAGSRPPCQADEQIPVGDIVKLSPRAGCLKQACPVR
jgi:hypothetical protein